MTVNVVTCDECKHQIKEYIKDKRYKEGGYWVYACKLNSDYYENHAVEGNPSEYCSSGELKGESNE